MAGLVFVSYLRSLFLGITFKTTGTKPGATNRATLKKKALCMLQNARL